MMFVCFSPVTTHKLIVTRLILCPTQLLIQQVYFPASSLLTFPIYIDLLKVKLSVVALTSDFPTAVVASKVQKFILSSLLEHVC